jgi:hypothetical protein
MQNLFNAINKSFYWCENSKQYWVNIPENLTKEYYKGPGNGYIILNLDNLTVTTMSYAKDGFSIETIPNRIQCNDMGKVLYIDGNKAAIRANFIIGKAFIGSFSNQYNDNNERSKMK